jgi:SET domain-containing protein
LYRDVDELVAAPREPWTHTALEVRHSPIAGSGLFATEPIAAGVVVIRLGGRLVNTVELRRLFADAAEDEYIDTFAVGDDVHIVLPPNTTAHFGNHSCDPSLWPVGALELVTRREVLSGEEITVDYGLISDDETFRMDCSCNAPDCRRAVTGEDWRRRDLQVRYAGHWPPGLQHRIDKALGTIPSR